jgi:tripartite ATP-independent transporter DctP family solute receptor
MNARTGFLSIAAALALTLGGAVQGAWAETFRLAHHHAVGGAVDQTANKFAELVNQKSGGAMTIRVFPGAQLGQEREAYDLVNQGGIDISITSTAILDKVYPAMAVTSVPFLFKGWEHAREVYKGEFGQKLAEGVRASSDSVVLGYLHLGFRDLLFTGEAPTTLAALKDRRMRSPENFVWIRMFELMGTRPTPVTWGEVYTAMQTGVAEGLDSPAATAIDMKFNEVTKSLLKTNHMFGSMLFAMNEAKFGALTPEQQAIIVSAAVEAGDFNDLEISMPAEQAAYGKLEALGVKVAEPADPAEWRAAMKPLMDEIATRNAGAADYINMLAD